jgi:hypothetical protein
VSSTASAEAVRQAITDLDRQRTQVRLTGRTFLVDLVMQAPDRFSSAAYLVGQWLGRDPADVLITLRARRSGGRRSARWASGS